MKDINKKIGVGVIWNFLELFLARSASTLFTIFLATLLSPEDFGLIAILAVVFELSFVLLSAGFAQALIRSKEVTTRDLSTAFWGNLGFALTLYLIIFLSAGQVAAFFAEPVLKPMMQVLGIGTVVSAFRIVQTTLLSRRMEFRPKMAANTTAVVVAGSIAVYLAYQGFGIWSLVANVLLAEIVATAMLWRSTHWTPRFVFDPRAFKRLFDFGKYLMLANLLTVAFNNVYPLVIAKLFNPELTGLYYFANKVSNLVSRQLTNAIQRSSFPALATLQDKEIQLRHKYRQILQLSMSIMAPIMILFIALSRPLFELLFDERWGGAVIYAQWLSIVGLLYPVHALNVNVLMVKGRSDLNLKLNIIKKSLQIVFLIAAIPFGVLGIVIGQVVSSVITLIPNSYYTYKLIDYGLRAQVTDIARPIAAGAVAGAAAWLAVRLHLPSLAVNVMLAGILGGIAYLAASILLRAEGVGLVLRELKKVSLATARGKPPA